MQDFTIFSILGWNLEQHYILYEVPRSTKVVETAGGSQAAFNMMSADRCGIMGTHAALILGEISMHGLELPNDIACRKTIEEGVGFHIMVAKKPPRSKDLVTALSTSIIHLQRMQRRASIEDEGYFSATEDTQILFDCL